MLQLPDHMTKLDPNILLSDSYAVVDVETTNLEKGNASIAENQLLLLCVKYSDSPKVYRHWGSVYEIQEVVDKIASYTLMVAHNSKMELKWLARAGLDLTKSMPYCTLIGEYILRGNRRGALDLGTVSAKYNLGTKDIYCNLLMKGGVCPSEIPRSVLEGRCVKDVLQTEGVFLQQRELLKQAGLLACAYTRNIFTPVLADIELSGLQLDVERVAKLHKSTLLEFNKVQAELSKFLGDTNPNSGKQMAYLLYGIEPENKSLVPDAKHLNFKQARDHRGNIITTPAGAPATSTDIILKLKATTKRQKEFQKLWAEHAKLDADLGKALDKFKLCCQEADGLLFAQFNQAVTKTTRLSSSGVRYNVQFQNLARKFKPLFCSRRKAEGWKIGEIDGAQIEFRVAGYLGQDVQVFDDLIHEADIHKFTASELNACSEEAVTKEMRTNAKADTFKPLYGGQSGTEAQVRYYTAFRKKYAGVTSAQDEWKREALRTGKVVLPTGFVFYFPGTKMLNDGYVTNSTNICNYPVQYFATGEIVPIGVTYLWHKMKASKMQSFLVNTVHDSAIAELCPGEEEQFRLLGQEAMTEDTYNYLEKVYGIQFNIPLGTGCEYGSNWSEGEEVKYQLEPKAEPPTGHDKHQAVGSGEPADF